MVVDVMLAESAAAARQYGTIVLQCAQPSPQPGRPVSAGQMFLGGGRAVGECAGGGGGAGVPLCAR